MIKCKEIIRKNIYDGRYIMENVPSPAFRGSLRGYNKSDVNEYLLKLNREFDSALSEKDEEISNIGAKLNAANAEIESIKKDVAKSEELDKANSVIAAQNEKIEELTEQVERLKAELSSTMASLESYGEVSAKVSQYETMTNKMGEIYMEATADADRLRREAKQAADELKAKTEKECAERKAQLEVQLREFASLRKGEISRLLSESQAEIDRVLAIFGERTRALVDESLTAQLDGFKTPDNI